MWAFARFRVAWLERDRALDRRGDLPVPDVQEDIRGGGRWQTDIKPGLQIPMIETVQRKEGIGRQCQVEPCQDPVECLQIHRFVSKPRPLGSRTAASMDASASTKKSAYRVAAKNAGQRDNGPNGIDRETSRIGRTTMTSDRSPPHRSKETALPIQDNPTAGTI